jgi:hypothetical protein
MFLENEVGLRWLALKTYQKKINVFGCTWLWTCMLELQQYFKHAHGWHFRCHNDTMVYLHMVWYRTRVQDNQGRDPQMPAHTCMSACEASLAMRFHVCPWSLGPALLHGVPSEISIYIDINGIYIDINSIQIEIVPIQIEIILL